MTSSILLFFETSLKKGSLNSSNTTYTDSSTTKFRLLKTLNVLLIVEYPKQMASSDFESNFPRLSLPLFST